MISRVQPTIISDKQAAVKASSINRIELERLRGQLMTERSSFVGHWQELGRYILPRRTRFYTTDVDRGNRRNQAIVDSTAGLAARTCRGGMMSAFTSPSRPWFRLSTSDPDLAKFETVKEWLYDVTWAMSNIFLKSNLYTSLQSVYGDMEVFGTSCMLLEEDFQKVIHTYTFPIGSYYLFANYKLRIEGFMRDFRLTVRQIVEQFGMEPGSNKIDWTNISALVHSLWDAGTTEAWIEMSHAVIPNPRWDPQSMMSNRKKFLSVYWERGSTGSQYSISESDSWKVLSQKGYDKFRILAPRWEVTGEDVYATYCPGMEALGDTMQLQTMTRRGAQALEKSINPPMVGPSSLKTAKATVLPGDITFIDVREGQQGFTPAYQINPNFQQFEIVEAQIRDRINRCFYDDLWHVVSNLERAQVTAEEIRALKEEKLQDIGPVVDRLNQDLLDPLIENTFDIMVAQGKIPPPPPELAKQPLQVEYTSLMAQAQKALGIATIERFVVEMTQIKQVNPEDQAILDKVDWDETIDHYGDGLTLPPGIVRDDDMVAEIRKTRDQQMKAQQAMIAAEQASKAAKNLSESDTGGQNALTDLMDQSESGNLLPGATG